MADSDFNKLRVDDARVTKVVFDGKTVLVSIRDWQANAIVVAFAEAIGIQGFGIVDIDLGGASESSTDPLIVKACCAVDEPVNGFQCYTLFSAWNDQPIIQIVARSWEVSLV